MMDGYTAGMLSEKQREAVAQMLAEPGSLAVVWDGDGDEGI